MGLYDLVGSSDSGTELFRFLRKRRFCTHFWWQTNRRTDRHLIAYYSRCMRQRLYKSSWV